MDKFLIFYRCPRCDERWSELWDCACDSECPTCNLRNIKALDYIEVEHPADHPAFEPEESQEAAEKLAARAQSMGIECHVKRWYHGVQGWFVIRNGPEYARLLARELA